jgi:ADP-ribosylglycohydrolase
MGYLKHAFILAFMFLLRTDLADEELYDEAMWQTAALGGDTDTNCAIVGGLIGAYLGLNLIPKTKVDKVLTCKPKKGRNPDTHAAMMPSITAVGLI